MGSIVVEDTPTTLTLQPGSDVDYDDALTYWLFTAPSSTAGVLSDCMNLVGNPRLDLYLHQQEIILAVSFDIGLTTVIWILRHPPW